MEKHRFLISSARCPGYPIRIGMGFAAFAGMILFFLVDDCKPQAVPNPPQNPVPFQKTTPGQEDQPLLEEAFMQREQSVFVPAPRDLVRPLIRANRAIAEKDLPRAVSLLGDVLSGAMNEDFLVPLSQPEGVSVSLRLKAQEMLGSLSAKDRELYRLRYGTQAKQMLEKAVDESNFELVSQVMQRFFYTEAGFDAAMLLGHYHLDQGRPIAAANCFQRIVNSDEARAIFDPEASVLLATCWMLGDSPTRANTVLSNLRNQTTSKSIQFLGNPVRLFDRPEDADSWLQKLIGDSPLRNNELVSQWVMFGGNPQRNARSGMGFPLLNPKWVTPTMNDPDLENSVRELQRELIVMDSAPIPSVQPLAVGNTIVMRTFDRMVGVDFETGKRVWVFPPGDFINRFDDSKDQLQARVVNKSPLTERLWQDAVYGQASSDGQTIFVVPNPGFSVQARTPLSDDAEPTLSRSYNELKAIDIQREGALIWEVGGESGLDESKLAKAFFLGAPLPLNDELFAVCQQGTEIRLVVLDAGSGRLKWHQQVGTTETSAVKLLQDRYRRLAGVTPSFADGIVVCSTGTGALVAIDVSTRSLLWGNQYSTPGRKSVQPVSALRSSDSDPLDGLWRDSTIMIADGKVFFTPVDAQDLICADLQTGFPTWNSSAGLTAKTNRNDSIFLACVEDGLAILVGETSVRAISVKTGEQAWEQSTAVLGKPSGRGYANHGCYYFPTTREKLVQIRLTNGEIVKTVDTDGVLGNLICFRGSIVSHGVDRLACFPQDAPNRKRVAVAEAAGTLTPELMAIKAQLQMQDGQFREAVGSIQDAYLRQPSRTYENLLLDWVIQVLEEDFDYGMELAIGYEKQLLANRRFEFLTAKINGMIRNNHAEAAMEELFALLDQNSNVAGQELDFLEIATSEHDQRALSNDVKTEPLAPQQDRLTIRVDRWVGSRLELLHAEGSADFKKLIEARIGELAEKEHLFPASDRHDLLRMFPMKLIPVANRFELARALIEAGDSLRAAQILESLSESEDARVAASAIAIAATDLLEKKMFGCALESIERLASDFPNVDLVGGQNVSQVVDVLRQSVTDARSVTRQPTTWKRGAIHVSTETNSEAVVNPSIPSPIEIVACDSPQYANYQYQFFGQTGEIEILDGYGKSIFRFLARETSQPLYSSYSNYVFGRISIKNHLALVDISTEIFMFDLMKLEQGLNPVLWNRSVAGERDPTLDAGSRFWQEIRTTATPRNYENRVFVSAPGFEGICYLDRNQLVCVDPFTGTKYWQRFNLPPNCKLLGDSKHVIVWDSQNREAMTIDSADGSLLKSTRLEPEVGTIWHESGARILVSSLSRTPSDASSSTLEKNGNPDEPANGETAQTTRKMMGLYDLLHDEFVWKTDYPMATSACLVGRDRIAVMPPGDELELLDIQSGKIKFHSPIILDATERAQVNGIGVSVNRGNYLIHFKRGDSASRISIESRNIRIRPLSYSDRLWVGSLTCIDSTTGANLWDNAVRFDNFQLGPSQPNNAPMYLLVRNVTREDETGMPIGYVQFVGIDTMSGKLAVNYLHLNNDGFGPPLHISCDPSTQRVTINSSGSQINLEWVEDLELPPRPVTHLTNQNSIPNMETESQVSTVDREMIESEKQKFLQRAIAAQKLLPQKRADEKRRLQAEKTNHDGN